MTIDKAALEQWTARTGVTKFRGLAQRAARKLLEKFEPDILDLSEDTEGATAEAGWEAVQFFLQRAQDARELDSSLPELPAFPQAAPWHIALQLLRGWWQDAMGDARERSQPVASDHESTPEPGDEATALVERTDARAETILCELVDNPATSNGELTRRLHLNDQQNSTVKRLLGKLRDDGLLVARTPTARGRRLVAILRQLDAGR